MKLFKRIFAISLCLAMIFSSVVVTGVTSSAIEGGGLPTTVTYSFGCDLSTWNVDGASVLNYSLVDFEKMVADGCEFAILRVGFEGSSTGVDTMDAAFLQYYESARAAGMKLGAYFYSHATTYSGAVADAEWVIDVINNNNMYFEYPIYYDVEESDQTALSQANFTNLCLGWCETMEAAGFLPGVYATLTNINNKLTDSFKATYETWGARVKTDYHTGSSANQYGPYDYAYYENAGMWQYAFFDYEYDGIGLDMLDVNVCYKDYPAITATYGYNNCVPVTDKTALKTAIDTAAAISYTSYTETQLRAIRSSYDDAAAIYYDSTATQTEIDSAATALNNLLAVTGSNSGGVRVNGFNKKITDGDCHIFTSKFDTDTTTTDWEVSVSNANIAYTLNVVCEWDNSQQSWVVKSKSTGSGTSTPSITLASDEILIACHYSTAVTDSASSFNNLNKAVVGNAIDFFGITLQGSVQGASIAAYIRVSDGTNDNLVSGLDYTISGTGTTEGNYTASLTDGIASANVVSLAGNWFAFKAAENSNTYVDSVKNDEAGYVIFDLGAVYDLSKVKLHLANIYNYGVPTPWGITLSVSNDGESFTDYGTNFPLQQGVNSQNIHINEYAYWTELNNLGVTGRYVKVTVGVSGTWAFLNEIEVYGEAHSVHVEGDWAVSKAPTTTESGEAQQLCTGCGEVVATQTIASFVLGDANGDSELSAVDYLILRRYCLGMINAETLSEPLSVSYRCDVNGDGAIGAADYLMLKRIIMGQPSQSIAT